MPLLEMSEKISLDAKERLCFDDSWQVCPGHPSMVPAALCSLFRIWDVGQVGGLRNCLVAQTLLPSLLFGLLGLIFSHDGISSG